jgi:hypothetical protein
MFGRDERVMGWVTVTACADASATSGKRTEKFNILDHGLTLTLFQGFESAVGDQVWFVGNRRYLRE